MISPYVWNPNAIPPLKIVAPKKNGTLLHPFRRSWNQHPAKKRHYEHQQKYVAETDI